MCKSRQDFSSRSRCLCVSFPNKGSHENLYEMSIEVIRCSPLSLHTVKRIKNITSSNYDFINKMLLIKKPMKTHTGIHYEYNPLKYNQFYFYKMVRYRILSWFFYYGKAFMQYRWLHDSDIIERISRPEQRYLIAFIDHFT